MTPIDHRAAADVAALLASTAAVEIMPRFRRLEGEAVRTKSGPLDLVTDADEAAERGIAAGLHARFPGCLVVGEEASAADPALLGRLGGAELCFTVDPIDGTANYAAGLPLFGSMVAAIARGEVIGSWIHDPVGGDTAIALRGEGAWIEDPASGRRSDLRVAAPRPLRSLAGAVSWSWLPEPRRSRVLAGFPALASLVNFRCAAHEWRLLASGHLGLLLYGRLLPWDHAPGWLLHQEAGGYSARLDGGAYDPTVHTGGLLATSDRATWDAARDALLG